LTIATGWPPAMIGRCRGGRGSGLRIAQRDPEGHEGDAYRYGH